jgi:RHS repeat-associated protein
VPGQQFDYTFDTIGNRTQTLAGGDQNGANQRLASYYANNLNQLTSRQYPGTNDIIGVALATNAVTVNGQPAFHKWEYFWGTVATNNTTSANWVAATAASGGASSVGSLYLPQTPEQFQYDLDGNLLSDGRWNYTWDAENRLTGMTVNTAYGPQYQLTFAYDALGRRIQKSVTTNGTSFTTLNFAYDGWNPIAILSSPSSILTALVWGSDLSGSMQGAGGVGGLLEVSYHGSSTTNCFPAFGGNGNVAGLVNAADGTVLATYEYGPFGEVIRSTGPMAKANPFRFSTKYQDDESDLLYYGRRYYKPSTGTWLIRDPKDEGGGLNLYGFVANNPITKIDRLGLDTSGAADGQSLSSDQHNTYLIFHISCGPGKMPTGITIDYDTSGMWNDMYAAWGSGVTEQQYETWIISGFNSMPGNGGGWGSGFGSPTPRNDPPSGLCSGGPIEIDADMRTRFVSPGWKLGLWREGYDIDPDKMLSFYKNHVRVDYTCEACSCQKPKAK